jgi:hypothetical protein
MTIANKIAYALLGFASTQTPSPEDSYFHYAFVLWTELACQLQGSKSDGSARFRSLEASLRTISEYAAYNSNSLYFPEYSAQHLGMLEETSLHIYAWRLLLLLNNLTRPDTPSCILGSTSTLNCFSDMYKRFS